MNIKNKYEQNRDNIKSGDIVLFRGKSILARLIRYFDNSYMTHVGVVFSSYGRLMIMDSNARGVHPDFLSDRMNTYVDFEVLRMNLSESTIDNNVCLFFVQEEFRKYDFALLLRIAIHRKLGIDLEFLGSSRKDICSEAVRRFTNDSGIKCYDKFDWITPEDFYRWKDPKEISVVVERY